MNLVVIVALTLWVLAEKFLPFGERTAHGERMGSALLAAWSRRADLAPADQLHQLPQALRHAKGAYCALLRPVVSVQRDTERRDTTVRSLAQG